MLLPGSRILIVDDMSTMRKMVTKMFKTAGFENVSEATCGSEAWGIISSANPLFDLVVSDWNMPNGNGIDLLKRFRADSRYVKTPFMMVTAEAEKDQIAEAIQSKVTAYIIKPFTADVLMEKLKAI